MVNYPGKYNFLKNHSSLYIVLILLAGLLTSIAILCMVPPISRDALVHHLAVPKLYLKHGRMYEIHSMVFSYYPMNIDLLYLIPLYWNNDIAPKIIHYSFGIMTAVLIFNYLKNRINRLYALLGAVLFLSTPIIVKLSITVYVDLGLVFFSTLSILHIIKWVENKFKSKYLIISAVSCGLCMGVKYNGLIVCLILFFFIPFLSSRYGQKGNHAFLKAVTSAMLFLVISLLVFSPWMIRNYAWKGNPIYPLYDNIFNSSALNVNKDYGGAIVPKKANYGVLDCRRHIYGESWWEIASIPIRIFFQGEDDNPRFFDGRLNPFLLIFPIFPFVISRNKLFAGYQHEKYIFLWFIILYFSFTFFSRVLRVRYLAPTIPFLVILSIFGFYAFMTKIEEIKLSSTKKGGYLFTTAMMILCLFFNFEYIKRQYQYVAPFSYINKKIDRDAYITKYRSEYPAMQYINANLADISNIVFLFIGKRGYYCDKNYIIDTTEQIFASAVSNADNAEDIYAYLQKRDISHMFVQSKIFDAWANDLFKPQQKKIIKIFFKNYLKKLFKKYDFIVFELHSM